MKKIMRPSLFVIGLPLIIALGLFLFQDRTQTLSRSQAQGKALGYPSPRYPTIRRITSVEELLPSARVIVSKSRDMNMRPGYGIKGKERVLFLADNVMDPLVVEAFTKALREKGATVDVWSFEVPPSKSDGLWQADDIERWLASTPGGGTLFHNSTYIAGYTGPGAWIKKVAEEQKYDLVIGMNFFEPGKHAKDWLAYRMIWPTRETLASAATTYPEEILERVETKTWEHIRQAKSIHITDPEGTDLQYDIDDELWDVVEGRHPRIRVSGTLLEYRYGPGSSAMPLVPGHLSAYPNAIVLRKSNAEGVLAGSSSSQGPIPRIVLTLKDQEIVNITGGGRYGKVWSEYLQKFKNIEYPTSPRPGAGFLVEVTIGTHPKVNRPHNAWESRAGRAGLVNERGRSGVMHIAFGAAGGIESAMWAQQRGLPGGGYDVHLKFPTLEATLKSGAKVRLIEKGRLTALDDPEVRRIAAKYGNPDELLREDWIPAIPGINVDGSYDDYAKDPQSWSIKEHRTHYGELLDWKPYP